MKHYDFVCLVGKYFTKLDKWRGDSSQARLEAMFRLETRIKAEVKRVQDKHTSTECTRLPL